MSKLAIIGAGYLQLPLVLKAREMGVHTTCFAWPDGAVCREHSDEFIPVSVTEKEAILGVCRAAGITAVTTIATDVAVPTVAHVAHHLGFIGNSPESAYVSTNKAAMRRALNDGGVRCPRFARLCPGADPAVEVADLRFPLIVKPCDRSGSAGVARVDSREALESALPVALSESLAGEAVVEEFVEGVEVSVECISWQGEHHLLAITDKVTTGPPHFVELGHHQPTLQPDGIRRELERQTLLALQALDIRFGASHSEFIIAPDGTVWATEIGARMGGDFIGSDLVPLSTGYDFLRGVVEVACGTFRTPEFGERRCAGVWFYTPDTLAVGAFSQKPDGDPVIVRSELREDALKPLTRSADRAGYVVYVGHSRLHLPERRST